MTKIGALWRKVKDGKKFFSGEVEIDGVKTTLMIFPNTYTTKKDGSVIKNPPDYLIFDTKGIGKKKVVPVAKKAMVPEIEED